MKNPVSKLCICILLEYTVPIIIIITIPLYEMPFSYVFLKDYPKSQIWDPWFLIVTTLPKTKHIPQKISFPKRKVVSKPPFFRDYVSFRELTPYLYRNLIQITEGKLHFIDSLEKRSRSVDVWKPACLEQYDEGNDKSNDFCISGMTMATCSLFCCGDGDVWCGWRCLVGSLLE